ncbi:MAG: SH3 domain-containing protein [Candidatus Omnitrophica bacterium]|nr:SH3 domain-containing protein [Candidatus Omnitrophota bacterium]
MKKIFLCVLMSLGFVGTVLSDEPAPSQLPHVKPAMLSAGYWIARHASADKLVMDAKQIENFNDNIKTNLGLTKDIYSLVAHFQTESLSDVFKKNMADYLDKEFFLADGTQRDANYLDNIKKNMHLNAVVFGVEPRYALVTNFANQRFFPTKEGLYAKRGDLDFDELQNSGLDIGTAVAVVHESLDKKWVYVLSSLSDGWVEADKLVIGDMQQIKNYEQMKDFVVITSPRADLFLDASMTIYYEFVRMGNKLPFLDDNAQQWVVQIPGRSKEGQLQMVKAYIPKAQAHRGYLPYTARTIYNQAFLMLDKPYGWGDMNGQQDCSRFLQMVFATVGIELPRDSKNQAQVGVELASFDETMGDNKTKLNALQTAQGALTLLPLKGHIMLYLGMVDGIPFAIHETSGFTKTQGERQIKYTLNKVTVSDLFLGEKSNKGSLLRRLIKIIELR